MEEAPAHRGAKRSSATPSARGSSDGGRSYPQAGPPGNDRIRLDALDHDQLLPARRAGDQPDGASGDPKLLGDEPEERLVRGPGNGRCRNVGSKHPVDDALDMVGPGPRGQPDGEADVGVRQDSKQAPQDAQHDQHDEGRQVEHPRSRERSADRREDRLRGRDDEPAQLAAAARIDPRQEHPADDQEPDGEERDLDQVAQEHAPSLAAILATPPCDGGSGLDQ
jgi:hypothetical protein